VRTLELLDRGRITVDYEVAFRRTDGSGLGMTREVASGTDEQVIG